MVARLTEEKGAHYLIEAFKRLDTDKKLVICGDTSDTDEYVARLKSMASGCENIIFTGFVSGGTLGQIYSNAYAVCLPSNLEGMSISLLEAMSYGNAVVCSDIPENHRRLRRTAPWPLKRPTLTILKKSCALCLTTKNL